MLPYNVGGSAVPRPITYATFDPRSRTSIITIRLLSLFPILPICDDLAERLFMPRTGYTPSRYPPSPPYLTSLTAVTGHGTFHKRETSVSRTQSSQLPVRCGSPIGTEPKSQIMQCLLTHHKQQDHILAFTLHLIRHDLFSYHSTWVRARRSHHDPALSLSISPSVLSGPRMTILKAQ